VPERAGNHPFRQASGKAMNQKIRVTTRANQFEKRKQEHLQAGYRIEDEQPFPMNGFCSFTAVRIVADEDSREEWLCRNQIFLQADRPATTPEMPPDQTNK
jgi:hypothetical protein